MRKVVSTEMKDKTVTVAVNVFSKEDAISSVGQVYCFPMDLVNARVALQIATLLVSDPTVPNVDDEKAK